MDTRVSGDAIVVGGGVIGLSTAVVLAEGRSCRTGGRWCTTTGTAGRV
ncbi:hypothetical protein [Streptomyces soliscabiei]|nr:hypothetical protein [Streptomyces sp. NY05-11A]MDX2674981.1 hypothetical protein [Streptomyces sp. NY05-11A]